MGYNHDHENEVTYFGKTNFRNSMTKFGVKTDDRRRHVYVIGKTGMGKTVLLENFTLSDIYAGHGCCYVDPHGDTAEKLINYIPSWRINDVVYFNPADTDYPVGFNMLEAVSESHKHLVASGMMGVFKKIWENMWSSRMEYILNNTILALLDNPGSTLLGINRMLSDAEYRKRIIGNVTDPVVRQFWLKEFASYNEKYAQEAVAPIQNKIGQFLSAAVIRNIVAQVKSTINVREIMDSGQIFIVNLSKGRIGEDNSRLLGGLLITKLQLSAMERVDMDEKDRLDFYLYVDEFQNFAVDSFAGILSEARKYRLCLTIAHQYIAQLTDEVREAVFGNVGTIITFRVGSPDAKYMETEFAPRFMPEDIINLPKYNVYLKLLINGVTSQPFSAMTLPPISQRTDSSERVIRVSRERYAKERGYIEDQILTWSGMGELGDVDALLAQAEDKKKSDKIAAKDAKKPKFEYNCSRCNKDMVLPVELDRSRPIYCEDCIEIVREEKNNRGGKSGGKPADTRNLPPKVAPKEPVAPPPRAVMEASASEPADHSLPDEPTISLETLKPKKEEEKMEPVGAVQTQNPVPAEPVPVPSAPQIPAAPVRVTEPVQKMEQKPVAEPVPVAVPKPVEAVVQGRPDPVTVPKIVDAPPVQTKQAPVNDTRAPETIVRKTEVHVVNVSQTPAPQAAATVAPAQSAAPVIAAAAPVVASVAGSAQAVRSMGNLSRVPSQTSNEASATQSTGTDAAVSADGVKRKRKRKRKKSGGNGTTPAAPGTPERANATPQSAATTNSAQENITAPAAPAPAPRTPDAQREIVSSQLSQPGQTISLKSLQQQARTPSASGAHTERTSQTESRISTSHTTKTESVMQTEPKTDAPPKTVSTTQTDSVKTETIHREQVPSVTHVAPHVPHANTLRAVEAAIPSAPEVRPEPPAPVVKSPQATSGKLYVGQSIKFE